MGNLKEQLEKQFKEPIKKHFKVHFQDYFREPLTLLLREIPWVGEGGAILKPPKKSMKELCWTSGCYLEVGPI